MEISNFMKLGDQNGHLAKLINVFIELSKYKDSTRVRIMEKMAIEGSFKRKVVSHIGVGRSDAEISILKSIAEDELRSF